jgi:excisionase family DNA binding protein
MNHTFQHDAELSELLGRLLRIQRPNGENHDPLLSRKEAAIYLGVSHRTLAIWSTTKRYNLPIVKIGRLAKYQKSALDAFVASRVR